MSIIHYVISGTVATMIGSNILHMIISSTIDSIYNSVSFLKNGTESHKDIIKIKKDVQSLDITVKLKMIQNLLNTLPETDISKIVEDGLGDIIYKIKNLVDLIDLDIEKHKRKWLNSYRSINLSDKMDELKVLVKILDSRCSMLILINQKNFS